MNGRYEPLPIHQTDERDYRGHSPVLNLELRWEYGRLLWFDPAAQLYLPTYEDERAARVSAVAQRDAAEAQREDERAARTLAEAQREDERSARVLAEERVRQLEAQLEQQQNPG